MRVIVSGLVLVGSVGSTIGSGGRDLSGQWSGHLLVDSQRLLQDAKAPEHRRLLQYTIARLKRSTVSLMLGPANRFAWRFDDGYPPDLTIIRGSWRVLGHRVLLMHGKLDERTENLQIEPGGAKLTGPVLQMKGVSAVYTRSR